MRYRVAAAATSDGKALGRRGGLRQILGYSLLALAAGCGGGGGGVSEPPPNPLYVSTAGRDTGRGDRSDPLRTINKALKIAGDDYEVIVAPGRYRESVTTDRTGRPAQRLAVRADVTGEETGRGAGAVVIDGRDKPTWATVELSNTAGSVLDGFTVTGSGDGGIVLKGGSNDAQVRNCIVFANRGTPGDGIRVQDSARVLLFNNLVHGNDGTGVGIVGTVSGSPDAKMISNTVVANKHRGLTVGTTQKASPRAFLRNNILVGNGDGSAQPLNVRVVTNPRSEVGFDGDFNLVFPATYVPDIAGVVGPHDINQDPRFANSGSEDYHLRANSPAIDAGALLDTVLDSALTQMLRQRTTTGGPAVDTGPFDIGFHYSE